MRLSFYHEGGTMICGGEGGRAMSFQVTDAAAAFILKALKGGMQPVRVTFSRVSGCGDKKLEIIPAALLRRGDVRVDMPGLIVFANMIDDPELSEATLDLVSDGFNNRLTIRSAKLEACGCGTSYRSGK